MANPTKLFPMFVTDKLAETRAFYVDKLGWTPSFDMPGYLQVRSADEGGPEIGFLAPDSAPPGAGRFAGEGVLVSVPVADADRHHDELRARGLSPRTRPELKPWGWRSYLVADPNGLVLDFFHVA